MPDNQPLVSIITPVYNGSRYLQATMDSVRNQDFEDWEHILVDDCSKDNSVDIIQKFVSADSRFRLLRNEVNSGSGLARNRAIKEARGRYIAFIDSDDLWEPHKLSRHIAYMQEKNAVLSHTSYGYVDANGNRIKKKLRVSRTPVSYKDLLKRTEIGCLTGIYDSGRIGKFYMSEHRRKQDYALWLSILKEGYKSYGLDEELAYYRVHPDSATSNKLNLIWRHVKFLQDTQGFNFFTAAYYTLYWMVNGFVRYFIK